jgi:hypothetical protein
MYIGRGLRILGADHVLLVNLGDDVNAAISTDCCIRAVRKARSMPLLDL